MAQRGFTLVELSIVMVIIGLVAGGILLGRDLIQAAQIRATIAQVQRFDSATNIFKSKYNAMAGDEPHPEQFFATDPWGAPANQMAGNGDGIINWWPLGNAYTQGYSMYGAERTNYFGMLEAAGLIKENYNFGEAAGIPGNCGDIVLPMNKIGGRIGVYTNSYAVTSGYGPSTSPDMKNYYAIGLSMNWSDCNDIFSGGKWKPSEARMLDLKIDDGNAMTGRVRVTTGDGIWSNVLFDPNPAFIRAYNNYASPMCNLNDDGTYGDDLYLGKTTGCTLRVQASW